MIVVMTAVRDAPEHGAQIAATAYLAKPFDLADLLACDAIAVFDQPVAVNDASGTDTPGGGWAMPMQDVVTKAAIDRAIDIVTPVITRSIR